MQARTILALALAAVPLAAQRLATSSNRSVRLVLHVTIAPSIWETRSAAGVVSATLRRDVGGRARAAISRRARRPPARRS